MCEVSNFFTSLSTVFSSYLLDYRYSIDVKWYFIVVLMCIYLMIWSIVGEGNGTPLQYSCLENPMDGGAW